MAQVIIPENISFNDWANLQMFTRPELNWPIAGEVEDWLDWAQTAYYQSYSLYPTIPIPNQLSYPNEEDWRKWAAQVIYRLI